MNTVLTYESDKRFLELLGELDLRHYERTSEKLSDMATTMSLKTLRLLYCH